MLDPHDSTEGITVLLQYSMQSNLQYPASPFFS